MLSIAIVLQSASARLEAGPLSMGSAGADKFSVEFGSSNLLALRMPRSVNVIRGGRPPARKRRRPYALWQTGRISERH